MTAPRKVVNVTWSSKESITDLEGYVLASLIRIASTGKIYRDRNLVESPKTDLTENLAQKIAGPFAFLMAAVQDRGLASILDVDAFMREMYGNPSRSRRALVWLNAHAPEIAATRTRLSRLVGKFSATG